MEWMKGLKLEFLENVKVCSKLWGEKLQQVKWSKIASNRLAMNEKHVAESSVLKNFISVSTNLSTLNNFTSPQFFPRSEPVQAPVM